VAFCHANNRGIASFATSSALTVFLRSNSSATYSLHRWPIVFDQVSCADGCDPEPSVERSTEVEMYSNRSEAHARDPNASRTGTPDLVKVPYLLIVVNGSTVLDACGDGATKTCAQSVLMDTYDR